MKTDNGDLALIDQQVLVVLEFVMRAEAKFATPLPEDIDRLQQKILNNISSVSGYSVNNPLEFYRLLRIFSLRDNPTMGEISESLSVSLSTATRVAKFLEKNGWATRQTDEIDGRITRLVLTDNGKEALNTFNHFILECNRQLLNYLTPQERVTLTKLLHKIAQCLEP